MAAIPMLALLYVLVYPDITPVGNPALDAFRACNCLSGYGSKQVLCDLAGHFQSRMGFGRGTFPNQGLDLLHTLQNQSVKKKGEKKQERKTPAR